MQQMSYRLHIRLSPKAARNAIGDWAQDADGQSYLKVSVTAPPEKGKANKALIALLAKEWKLPKTSISLIKGETDRNKILLLHATSPALEQILSICKT